MLKISSVTVSQLSCSPSRHTQASSFKRRIRRKLLHRTGMINEWVARDMVAWREAARGPRWTGMINYRVARDMIPRHTAVPHQPRGGTSECFVARDRDPIWRQFEVRRNLSRAMGERRWSGACLARTPCKSIQGSYGCIEQHARRWLREIHVFIFQVTMMAASK